MAGGSTPVVVQGTAVSSPSGTTNNSAAAGGGGGNSEAAPQGTKCNDIPFAILGWANFAAILAVAGIYGPAAFDKTDGSSNNSFDYSGYIYAALVTGVLSILGAGLGMLVLMKFPQFIIKVSLIFVIAMGLAIAIMSFIWGSIVGGILGVVFFAIGVCYARAAWPRIPFASVNLTTAIMAVQANFGIVLFSLVFAILAFCWSMVWAIAFAGVFDETYSCDANGNNCTDPNYGFLFLLFLAFFFGHQVLQNSIHVQIAGVVGTWWVAPDENGFCGSAVCNSFLRTITTSFGSICFGSLLVAILQALRALANSARNNGDAGIFACIAECILACLESILEYFNKWAFIYVGVYGFPYLQAGKQVFQLFRDRGWEAIIADDLVGNALFLVSLLNGLLMGAIAIGLEAGTDWFDEAGGDQRAIAFFIGFLVGIAIASVLMSTFASGVNAVIVLFADAPRDLERNYPEQSRKMRETWREIYPSEYSG